MNLPDIHNVTSSPELADGPMPCNLPDGQQIDLFGPDLAHASHSVVLESKKEKKTNGICGRCCSALSVNPDRQLCLENKCQPQFAIIGGMMWPMIWKEKVTPRGRKLGQLVVSARPINGTDCFLWPTITVNDATGSQYQYGKNKKKILKLTGQVKAMWPTPTTRDHKDGSFTPNVPINSLLGRQVWNGSTAQTANKGSLNPAFPCWLMGYPTEWENCGGMVTRLSRKSPRNL